MNAPKESTPENPNPTPHNRRSGSEVAQLNSTEPLLKQAPSAGKAKRTLSRTHADYWKSRLFRRTYASDGRDHEINDLYVRIQHAGRREFFALTTTNKDAAAIKARDIFTFLKANGWEATLAKFKADSDAAPKTNVTVGDYLAAVKATSSLNARTLLNYTNCLRIIIAETFGIRPKKGESKFDYRTGGNQAWVGRIDAIRIERLTLDRLNKWKRKRIAAAGHSPAKQAAAKRTVNSYLRAARSLFTDSLVAELKALKLPAPLPFAGVKLEESGSMNTSRASRPRPSSLPPRRTSRTPSPRPTKPSCLACSQECAKPRLIPWSGTWWTSSETKSDWRKRTPCASRPRTAPDRSPWTPRSSPNCAP